MTSGVIDEENGSRPSTDPRFVYPVLFLYLLLGAVLVVHHEAWRDEADSWLLARDATAGEIWDRLGYKGTPGLWKVVLAPFAKAGLPFETAGWVHLAIATLAAFVLLRFAPFSRLLKVLILFSYLLGYEYLAIARNYTIGILLLFILAALDDGRYERPAWYGLVLGLLANCSVHTLFIAAAVGLVFVIEAVRQDRLGRRVVVGLCVAVALGLVAVAQVWPPADGAHTGWVHATEWRAMRWSVSQSLFPGIRIGGLHWIALPVFGALLISLRSHARALSSFLLGWAGLLYVMTFKVVGGPRHFGIVFMLLLWALWVSDRDDRTRFRSLATRALASVLAVGVCTAAWYWTMEVRHPFSGARDMAEHLERTGLSRARIAVHLPATGSAVLAYLDERRTLWFPALDEEGSYMKWDRRYEAADRIPHDAIAATVRRADPQALLLFNRPLERPEEAGYRLLHVSSPDVFEKLDEVLYLYSPAGGEWGEVSDEK